jgi:hypothetical protein
MKKILAGLLLGMASLSTQATVVSSEPLIYLEPLEEKSAFAVGDLAQFLLKYDFTGSKTLGGGIDVFFNEEVLEFVKWTPENLGDPAFRRNPVIKRGNLDGIAFGDFNGLPEVATMGLLQFKVTALGSFDLILAADSGGVAGDFFSATTFQKMENIKFEGATITAVPLPAGVVLLGSAMMGLIGFRRKQTF